MGIILSIGNLEKEKVLIGLISDTHGLLRTQAIRELAGVELIVHAGDVGDPEILAALNKIAPVRAVRGNIDKSPPLSDLPITQTVEAGGTRIYVLHDIGQLDVDPAAAGFDVVVFGHSHKAQQYTKDCVTYINPGSAGPRRFWLPITLARLDTGLEPLTATFVAIEA